MKYSSPFRRDWLDHLLDRLLQAGRPVGRWQAAALSLTLLIGIATVDVLTGGRVEPDLVYSFPVVVAAWSIGREGGLWVAVLASFLMTALDWPGPVAAQVALPLLMLATRFAALVIVALTVSKLRAVTEESEARASADPLTGLMNRRSLEEHLSLEVARSVRHASILSVIYVDVDDFKSFNDRHGHAIGDDILRSVARCLGESLRATDLVGRVGGDEFVIVLPDTSAPGAQRVGSEVLQRLAHESAAQGAHVSAGAITFEAPAQSADAAIARADSVMYDAKRSGKNCLLSETSPLGRAVTIAVG